MNYVTATDIFRVACLGATLMLALSSTVADARAAEPPYGGTVWASPDVLTPSSPSSFESLDYEGTSAWETFDRREGAWVERDSHVFRARFSTGLAEVLVVVNSEFSLGEAEMLAVRFAYVLGQLPIDSRDLVEEIWVHDGAMDQGAGGGNHSILIHAGYAEGISPYIEEVFVHEAAHTSLDSDFGGRVDRQLWAAAQEADGVFISDYAEDYPEREDIAESYGAYVLHSVASANPRLLGDAARIEAAIPHRLAYFQSLGPEMQPSNTAHTSLRAPRNIVVESSSKRVQAVSTQLINDDVRVAVVTNLDRGSKVKVVVRGPTTPTGIGVRRRSASGELTWHSFATETTTKVGREIGRAHV